MDRIACRVFAYDKCGLRRFGQFERVHYLRIYKTGYALCQVRLSAYVKRMRTVWLESFSILCMPLVSGVLSSSLAHFKPGTPRPVVMILDPAEEEALLKIRF